MSWAACRCVFHIDWQPAPLVLSVGALLTALLVGVIGVLASADVLRKKPLATLRAEIGRYDSQAAQELGLSNCSTEPR